MKKFNQMTEKQMSKVNGGIAPVIFGFLGLLGGIVGTSVGAVKASEAIDKKAGK